MDHLPADYFVTSHQFTKSTHRDIYAEIDPRSISNSQHGKVIVITGASRGIGRLGFVPSFARTNPKAIVLVARSAESLQLVTEEVRAIDDKIEILGVAADISNNSSVSSLWSQIEARFGHADVLVNNAGTLKGQGHIADVNRDAWWSDFETNMRGTFLSSQAFMNLLGMEKKGTIINVVTMMPTIAQPLLPGISSYSISKMGVLQMQAFIAAESPNVTAIALHPGMIATDMTLDSFRRFALDTPELVGGIGVWLSTEKASFLSGKYVSANWSVNDLVARKDEIETRSLLSMALVGKFGN